MILFTSPLLHNTAARLSQGAPKGFPQACEKLVGVPVLLVFMFVLSGMQPAQAAAQISGSGADIPDEVQVFIADFHEEALRARMEKNAGSFLNAINQALSSGSQPAFSQELSSAFGADSFSRLWGSSPFYIHDEVLIEQVALRSSGSYEMRNIPLMMRDDEDAYHPAEAVLEFSPDGRIQDFRLALEAHRYQEIMQETQDEVDEENRRMIISFLEIFRTAFNQQDIDFIEQVFSDEALIIVGRVVEGTGESSPYEQQVEFLRFNKEEYISRLANVFEANTWIDVGFEDVHVFRHRRHPHMYGISVVQYYDSSIYSDVGYLFLLTDFSTPEEPMIHVRTWQPKQETPEGAQIGIGDIEIL